MQTIVIGHRNPDMDSICAAVGYARFKQLSGVPDVIAARAGNTNTRIDFVLEKFGVEAPVFLSDVSPRVSDVMQSEVVSIREDASIYDAIHLISEKRLRGLPVIDDQNHCLGLLSAFEINQHLFPARAEAANARVIVASVAGIVETFGGSLLAGDLTTDSGELVLMVGAMNTEAFSERLEHHKAKQIVLFVGDRNDILIRAIEARVRAIVVTGALAVSKVILAAAGEANVAVLSSPYDTATTVLLARGAVRAGRMIETEFTSFHPDTPLDLARDRAAASADSVFPVLDKHGALAGVLTKSDFLKPVPRQLILVDHNELGQAVPGASKVPIVEIIDHHRLGGFSSELPMHFWNNPVGSTSTIVTQCFQQAGIAIPPEIAGLLMAGLIADTLNLTSPTATPVDKSALNHLAKVANTDPAQLAEQIFSVGSPLLTMTPEEVITADCKDYEDHGRRFTVSQIEELSFSHFAEKQAPLVAALERRRRDRGLFFAALLVTDINTQDSLLLACGDADFLQRITFPARGPNIWELASVVSRKKQLLPYLLQCLGGTTVG